MLGRHPVTTPLLYLLTTLVGVTAFTYPLFLPTLSQSIGFATSAHLADAPLLLGGLVVLCVGVVMVEAQGTNPNFIALLGVLVAFNSALRFFEVALPGPGGFTPIFFLITLGGYCFGGQFGFLLGALTLLVSAFMTGGVGPWLPYQMFAAGWVGLSAPLCRPLVRTLRGEGKQREVVLLALFGGGWGFLFGAIMNLWFWPYATGDSALYWQPGIGWQETLTRYALFYAVTSWWWDIFAALGNMALLLAFGAATLRVLRRFRQRFDFHLPAYATSQPTLLAPPARPVTGNRDTTPPRLMVGLHPAVWVVWCGALTLWLSISRNPLYLLLLALILAVTRAALPQQPRAPYALPLRLLPLAAVMLPLAALANALFTHAGQTVLLRLPKNWPLVGGPLTVEALLYGGLTGLALLLILASFSVLNHAVTVGDLVDLLPRVLRPVGITVIIALTFVPLLVRQAAHVREAQAVRGYTPRGWREMLPLLLPLLIGGLERAIQLGEALAARGLGASPPLARGARWGIVGAVAAFFGGWWWFLLTGSAGARGLMGASALLLIGLLWQLGQRVSYVSYRHRPWRGADRLVAGAALLAMLPVLLREISLFYYPYPHLTLPALSMVGIGSLVLLLAPLLPLLTLRAAPTGVERSA